MIRHILSDGREVNSVEGIIIPSTGPTEAVYRIVAEHTKSHSKNSCAEEENNKSA